VADRALLYKPVLFIFRSAHVQEPRYLHRIEHLRHVELEVPELKTRILIDFGKYYIQVLVHDVADNVTPYALAYVQAVERGNAIPLGMLLADELGKRELAVLAAYLKRLGVGHRIAYLFAYMTPAQLLDILRDWTELSLIGELRKRGIPFVYVVYSNPDVVKYAWQIEVIVSDGRKVRRLRLDKWTVAAEPEKAKLVLAVFKALARLGLIEPKDYEAVRKFVQSVYEEFYGEKLKVPELRVHSLGKLIAEVLKLAPVEITIKV